ncbi:MAG: glycoside hydrolase family 32 protein [Microbacteriaceae bacterium]|nr:glycoside hydrolase family 32 protein [Microbacteriaceae bacterium]
MSPDEFRFHARPTSGWINDPNGLIQYGDRYHVFFQYNPESPRWGSIHWGHQSSADLESWREHPIALFPDQEYDADGCWSGCAVESGTGGVIAFYTGVRQTDAQWVQSICAATSEGDLDDWVKVPSNPVVMPPADLQLVGFRDPFVWRTAVGWSMIVGSGLQGHGGCILRYDSEDLLDWQFGGLFLSEADLPKGDLWLGTMWECPQLIVTDNGHALVLSIHDADRLLYTVGVVGDLENGRFLPIGYSVLDHGHDYYAPAVMRDQEGRWLSWGWAQEARTPSEVDQSGWAGLLTVPRELALEPDELRIRQTLVRELTDSGMARGSALPQVIPHQGAELDVAVGAEPALIRLGIAGKRASQVVIRLIDDEDTAQLVMVWDRYRHCLIVDREPSTQSIRGATTMPVDSSDDLDLTIVVDRTIVEIFTGEGRAATERVYGVPAAIQLTAMAWPAELSELEIR